MNESIISQNLQKHKEKHDSCFQDKNKILIIFIKFEIVAKWNERSYEEKASQLLMNLISAAFDFIKDLTEKQKSDFK